MRFIHFIFHKKWGILYVSVGKETPYFIFVPNLKSKNFIVGDNPFPFFLAFLLYLPWIVAYLFFVFVFLSVSIFLVRLFMRFFFMSVLILCQCVIGSFWIYFVRLDIFANGVAHKIHVGMDTNWFVVSSSSVLTLLVVNKCPHVCYVQNFVHRSS